MDREHGRAEEVRPRRLRGDEPAVEVAAVEQQARRQRVDALARAPVGVAARELEHDGSAARAARAAADRGASVPAPRAHSRTTRYVPAASSSDAGELRDA